MKIKNNETLKFSSKKEMLGVSDKLRANHFPFEMECLRGESKRGNDGEYLIKTFRDPNRTEIEIVEDSGKEEKKVGMFNKLFQKS